MKTLLIACLFILPSLGAYADTPQNMLSEYSPLDKCREVPQKRYAYEPNDSYEARCPAHNGYSVTILGGDVRTWLVLQKGRNKIDLYGIGEGDVHFPIIGGSKLEWRYHATGNKKELVALIFRINGQDPQNVDKNKSLLYVVRPITNGFCILGHAKSNDEAHQIADSGKLCP